VSGIVGRLKEGKVLRIGSASVLNTIVAVLKRVKMGARIADLIRHLGIAELAENRREKENKKTAQEALSKSPSVVRGIIARP
jgi:hypothetical protein